MLVKMKKWTLYALKQDRDALLMALQKDGSVMIESEGEKKGLEGAEEVSAQLEKTGQVLRFMAQNGAKGGLFPKRTELSYDAFLTPSQTGEKVTERVDTLANRVASLDSEAAALLCGEIRKESGCPPLQLHRLRTDPLFMATLLRRRKHLPWYHSGNYHHRHRYAVHPAQ